MQQFVRALCIGAIAALCGATSTSAWEISSTPSAATEDTTAPLAKTWTIVGAEALQDLVVHAMGCVFVDYDASLAASDGNAAIAAQVTVSGDTAALLDAIEVVDNVAEIKIHFRNNAFEGHGHLLTQVRVASPHALRNVTMAWSSDLVVGPDVLVENDRSAHVGLALVGSGDLYAGMSTTELSLASLTVNLTGSGDVQLLAKSLTLLNSVDLNVSGSGDIAVVADRVSVTTTLSSLVAGSGDVVVQSKNLTASSLASTIAGSGDITYSSDGSCEHQTVVVVGSGDVATSSIVCKNTDVNLVGSGDVLVQTTDNLTVASFFVGDVRYYGTTPRNITASSLFDYGVSHKHASEVVREAKKNTYKEYEVKAVPVRKPVYVIVKTSSESKGEEPRIHYALELETLDEVFVKHFLSQQQHVEAGKVAAGAETSWSYVVVMVGFAFVVGVVVKHMSGRRYQDYHAL